MEGKLDFNTSEGSHRDQPMGPLLLGFYSAFPGDTM